MEATYDESRPQLFEYPHDIIRQNIKIPEPNLQAWKTTGSLLREDTVPTPVFPTVVSATRRGFVPAQKNRLISGLIPVPAAAHAVGLISR